MDCIHKKQKFLSAKEGWVCQECGESIKRDTSWTPEDGIAMTGMQHDVDRIDEANLLTDPDLASCGLNGSQQERFYSDQVKSARGSDGGGDMVKSHYKIPRPVYFARLKQDPDYWKSRKNVERHADWRVK